MYCSNCGANLANNVGQCPACGAVFPPPAMRPVMPMPGAYPVPPKIQRNGKMTFNYVTHIISMIGFLVLGSFFFLAGVFVSFFGLFNNELLSSASVVVVLAAVLVAAGLITIVMLAGGGKMLLAKDTARYIKRELIMSVMAAAVSVCLLIFGLWVVDFDLSKLNEYGVYFAGWTAGLVLNVIAAVFAKNLL